MKTNTKEQTTKSLDLNAKRDALVRMYLAQSEGDLYVAFHHAWSNYMAVGRQRRTNATWSRRQHTMARVVAELRRQAHVANIELNPWVTP